MWFSLFAVVLILAITFYQGLLGLFSSVINCMLTILAACLAFGLHEQIYMSYLVDRQPDDGRATALIGVFVVSLLVGRIIVDLLVTENQHYPMYVDRIAGGAFGLVTAMIIIGTLTVSIQMLPFPYQFLGFTRYRLYNAESGELVSLAPKDEKQTEFDTLAALDLNTVTYQRQTMLLGPDAFAVGVAGYLSDNALAGDASMNRVHPALLDELHWARFNPCGQKTTAARKADGLKVEACWKLGPEELRVRRKDKSNDKDKVVLGVPAETEEELPSGMRWLAVRAKLDNEATDDGTNFRFTTDQVRLVTKGKGGRTAAHHLVGINPSIEEIVTSSEKVKDIHYRLARGEPVVRSAVAASNRFDFVFQIPDDADPWFIEFRRNARAEVRTISEEPPPTMASTVTGTAVTKKGDKKPGKNSGGGADQSNNGGDGSKANSGKTTTDNPKPKPGRADRISGVHSSTEGNFFGSELPLELTAYSVSGEMEIASGEVKGGNGKLIAKLTDQDEPQKGNNPPVKRLAVGEGKVIYHQNVEKLQPGSWIGGVMQASLRNQNCYAVTEPNERHPAIGMYAIATVNGQRTFELCFFDETSRMSGAAVPKLEKIKADDLKGNYELYFIFEIPAGARVVEFENPRGRREDLRSLKLVAPK